MSKQFKKLTRATIRKLPSGGSLTESGITFERLKNGDGRYSVNIMVDGQRVHRVIGRESEGVTRTQAEEFIAQTRADSRHGRLNLPKARKTALRFTQAAERYLHRLEEEDGKDLKMKRMRFSRHLTPFFKNMPLSKIATFDVERYKKVRVEEGAASGTINRELAVLSHVYSKAMEWRWIDHKPVIIRRFKEDAGRITYLTTDQVARLVEASKQDQNPHIYPFIVIGLGTSMRRSEILSIRLEDIDLDRQMIYVRKAKAGAREQPITKELAGFLKGYMDAAEPDQEWLFPSGSSASGHMENPEKPWKRVVEAAGLDPKNVVRHTLRHTAITHLVQAGVDLPTVQRISGHKTLQMVVRYSHQNGEHIRAAMDKLERRYKGRPKVVG